MVLQTMLRSFEALFVQAIEQLQRKDPIYSSCTKQRSILTSTSFVSLLERKTRGLLEKYDAEMKYVSLAIDSKFFSYKKERERQRENLTQRFWLSNQSLTNCHLVKEGERIEITALT